MSIFFSVLGTLETANESFAEVANYGLQPNMILYLTREYHLEMATASNVLFFWSAATNFMPLLGAMVADSFLGRYWTILFGCLFCLLVNLDSKAANFQLLVSDKFGANVSILELSS